MVGAGVIILRTTPEYTDENCKQTFHQAFFFKKFMKQLQLRKTISKIFKISSERERGIKQKLTALGKEVEEKSKTILEM